MSAPIFLWVPETPMLSGSCTSHGPCTRRSHRKSRAGCMTCKQRRVKCDEEHPICGQCRQRKTGCLYTGERNTSNAYPTPSSDSAPSTSTSQLSSEACLGVHVFANSIARIVSQSASSGQSSNSFVYFLRHFETSSYRTLSSPTGQRILHDKIPSLLMSHPYLLHTVLAYSSSHLQYLSKNRTRNSLGLATSYHTQRALHLYGERIGKKSATFDVVEVDALFAACILLTSLFYHLDQVNLPHSSWTLSNDGNPQWSGCQPGIDWLTNISGPSILLRLSEFQQKVSDSCWFPFFVEASPAHRKPPPIEGQPKEDRERAEKINEKCTAASPPHLLQLANSSPLSSTYRPTLELLATILRLDPTDLSNFTPFIAFPSRLSPAFIALVRQSSPDPTALLILGYWFSSMAQVPHWWCKARGVGEAVAIAWYVERLAYEGGATDLKNALAEFKVLTGTAYHSGLRGQRGQDR